MIYRNYSDNMKDLIIIDRSTGNELADLFTTQATIKRVVNNEFHLAFSAPEQELKTEFLKDNSILADNQLFDMKLYEKSHNKSGSITYNCQAYHVFWRLLDKSTETLSYAMYGTPTAILTDLLQDTEFNVGQVDFTSIITFAVNQTATTGQKILALCNVLGGEIEYTDKGFTINILNTIGQNNGFEIRLGKNLKTITEVYDTRDEEPITAYVVDILELKNTRLYTEHALGKLEVLGLGDTIYIVDEDMNIDTTQRILSIEYDPRFAKNTKLEIANTIKLFTDDAVRVESESINKTKTYYGIKINPNVGFEVERSDKLAKATFNADEFRMQTGDGLGGYVDSIYFDPIDQVYKFTGTLEATDIIGGTITGSTITGNNINGNTITGGSISIGSNFSVDSGGNMYANNGSFRGDITGSTITGNSINGNTITGGSISIGNNFDVDSNGNMTANNGSFRGDITGSTITSSILRSTNGYGSFEISEPSGNIADFKFNVDTRPEPLFELYNNITRVDLRSFDGTFLYTTGNSTTMNNTWKYNNSEIANQDYAVEDNVEQGIRLQVFGGRLEFYSPSTGWVTLANLNDIP